MACTQLVTVFSSTLHRPPLGSPCLFRPLCQQDLVVLADHFLSQSKDLFCSGGTSDAGARPVYTITSNNQAHALGGTLLISSRISNPRPTGRRCCACALLSGARQSCAIDLRSQGKHSPTLYRNRKRQALISNDLCNPVTAVGYRQTFQCKPLSNLEDDVTCSPVLATALSLCLQTRY